MKQEVGVTWVGTTHKLTCPWLRAVGVSAQSSDSVSFKRIRLIVQQLYDLSFENPQVHIHTVLDSSNPK